ncbi:hypothetical protein SAMN02746066_04647 [Anaerosporobacter mobilis DSM 15930]|uniref:Uncharacterized protein n=1 Tax=Anaerosporobacter mobilis DSM 15930 TaxID=1120996 RepID=A0A1M7NQA4_9FIRM|nr:hypothetical protein [Anaerosporobacter mobilis]SHN05773.1 hypothetical protein SAMN02746066_04647 [Anaerosporobacter mobilis DSM 15930]
MIDTKIFDMLYSYLEERSDNNVRSQLNADPEYQNALAEECELYQKYENLNLSKEQCKVIENWVDAVTAQNSTYSAVLFRMGMQCCFSLLMQLADLK